MLPLSETDFPARCNRCGRKWRIRQRLSHGAWVTKWVFFSCYNKRHGPWGMNLAESWVLGTPHLKILLEVDSEPI